MQSQQSTLIPATGWRLSPAGTMLSLPGDMPLKIVPAPDGKSLLVVTAGYHDHAIDVIDPTAKVLTQVLPLGKAWAGLAVDSARNDIYVSGGGSLQDELNKQLDLSGLDPKVQTGLKRPILCLKWTGERTVFDRSLSIPELDETNRFIGGVATDSQGSVFAVSFQTNYVFKVDPLKGTVKAKAHLGYRPFQIAVSSDGADLAVGNWGAQSISLLHTADLTEYARIAVGIHPTDLVFARDGRLFVANASSNSISVVRNGHVIETIVTSLHPSDPVGSTPSALAVSQDGTRLYVANADNNDIAVIDVHESGHSLVLGFIPTGWYPSSLALTPDGKQLVVGIAKGAISRPNWPAQGPRPIDDPKATSNVPFDYIGRVMSGAVEIIAVPDATALAKYTQTVEQSVPKGEREVSDADRREAELAFHGIKHVIYIIRENRTYDQNLGDDPRGDGDKDLTYFGEKFTPNVHQLVKLTPLLDRYFVNGEVSEDGHYWANSAYSTIFNELQTASMQMGHGRVEQPGMPIGLPGADERLFQSPAGYLWEVAKRTGLSYFDYGEFGEDEGEDTMFTSDRDIEGHMCLEWGHFFEKNDVDRARLFTRDLKAAEHAGQWPSLVVMSLPWDHTMGLSPGKPTPQAMVAINDLGLGMIVDAVTHSSFWSSTAIFVTEDDAQGGPDHVDAHRSVALVISPYVKQGLVDHTSYTMTSMVRTIELILGLPSMTQHDRNATPMYRLFQSTPTLWTYTAAPETVDLEALNPGSGPLAEASSKLDFSGVDRADPEDLNAILWAALKPGVPYPAPVHSAVSLGLR